jgi:hypothetical protein
MCAAAGPFFLFLAYVAKSPMLFCELMPMAVGGFLILITNPSKRKSSDRLFRFPSHPGPLSGKNIPLDPTNQSG